MSKLPLDLSKFRKVKSDGKTSTFRHYQGHELTVAHHKLSSKLRGDLEKIPVSKKKEQSFKDGGEVLSDEEPVSFLDATKDIQYPEPTFTRMAANEIPVASEPLDSSQASPVLPEQAPTLAPTEPVAPAQQPSQELASPATLQGLQKQTSGQVAQMNALGAQGTMEAAHEQAYQAKLQAAAAQHAQQLDPIQKERQALMADIAANHVNPERYINNMATGDKIRTGIALVLGGMGAGLTHGPNLVFQYLQDQITRDIDAQKAELGKKQNLLSHNLQQSKDLREAYETTRIQTIDLLNSQLRMTADQTADPLAKATILQIVGQNDQKAAQIQSQMMLQRMITGGAQQPGQDSESQFRNQMQALRLAGKGQVADQMEAKRVPGVGIAYTADDAKEMKAILSDSHAAVQSIQRLKEINQIHGKSMSPGIRAEAYSISKALVGQLNRAFTGGGPMSEGERELLNEIAKNPTSVFSLDSSNKTSLDTLQQTLQHKVEASMKARGLVPGSSINTPDVKMLNGKPYRLDPSGKYMIPVTS